MMMAHVIEDMLIENGIDPHLRGKKTTCPYCSDYRVKRNEKCLKITIDHNNSTVSWFCFHCKLAGKTT